MSKKIIFLNILIFIFFIFFLEMILGYWFSKNNFGYHMRDKRLIQYKINSEFNNKNYDFIYKRNFYGFRIDKDIKPKYIDVVFEGGSTADELPIPEHLTIVGHLNAHLKKNNLNLFIGNAAVSGKSTKGYLNDFKNWFPRLDQFNPKMIIFFSGINDSSIIKNMDLLDNHKNIEDNTYENKLSKKIYSYLTNNSFILIKIKIIKDKYFDLNKEKIKYDVNKKDLYKNFVPIDIIEAESLYGTLDLNKKENLVVNYYRKNLKLLKAEIEKQNIIPIFITQLKYDGISEKILYLINKETKNFCEINNYQIIKLDEILYPEVGDYYDYVHTTPEGSLKIANIIYKELKVAFNNLAKIKNQSK